MTSHDVVAKLRRATSEKSIGHLGTLDPMATGVLPLLLGRYTRLAQFYGSHEKAYTGTIRFGFATDTYDAEGKQTSELIAPLFTSEELLVEASRFSGEMDQLPPPISAKKIGGKRAYEIARSGETPQLKTAKVKIDEFAILDYADGVASFRMKISAGGYVRSVAHELGQAMGCGAHLASLRRVMSGVFALDQSIVLDEAIALAQENRLEAGMPHPRTMLPEFPSVTADRQSVGRLRNGMAINLPEYSSAPLIKIFEGQRNLVAIGKRLVGTLFHPSIVL